MRVLAVIPLALLVSACWKPGPGQVDPTRYPWDQPKLRPQPEPQTTPEPPPVAEAPPPPEPAPQFTACVVALEPTARSGIVISGNAAPHPRCGPDASTGIEVTSESGAEIKPGEIVPSSAWNTNPPPSSK